MLVLEFLAQDSQILLTELNRRATTRVLYTGVGLLLVECAGIGAGGRFSIQINGSGDVFPDVSRRVAQGCKVRITWVRMHPRQ
jgi:hypothetical protein